MHWSFPTKIIDELAAFAVKIHCSVLQSMPSRLRSMIMRRSTARLTRDLKVLIQTKRKITITIWKTKMKNKKVVLGLSGGVDSTTAALLLQEKGYEVIGLYFDAMGKGREDAGAVRAETAAQQLGIRFLYRDVSNIFREKGHREFLQ